MRQAAPWRSGRTRRFVLTWWLTAFAPAVLAACVAAPGAEPATATVAPSPATVVQPVTPAPPQPQPNPGQLLGMRATHLKTLLGEPDLIRQEPPAQVWLYSAGICVFHVYLYRQAGIADYRVTHYDVSAPPRRIYPARDCFGSLLQRAEHRQLDS